MRWLRCSVGLWIWIRWTLASRFWTCRNLEEFWSKVDRGDGCWLWQGRIAPNGYGRFSHGGKDLYAHRVAYELAGGVIPSGLQIDHLCRVRHCVNPAHLEAVTQRENLLRGEGLTAQNARAGVCKHGHEFTPENTYYRPDRPGRICVKCSRRRKQEGRARGVR